MQLQHSFDQRTEPQCTSTARPWPPQRLSWRFSRRPPAGRLAQLGQPEALGTDPCSNWRPWSKECVPGAACVVARCARSCGEPSAGCAAAPRRPARRAQGSERGLHHTTPWPAARREHWLCDIEGGTAKRRPVIVSRGPGRVTTRRVTSRKARGKRGRVHRLVSAADARATPPLNPFIRRLQRRYSRRGAGKIDRRARCWTGGRRRRTTVTPRGFCVRGGRLQRPGVPLLPGVRGPRPRDLQVRRSGRVAA
jgi:hypothetical protein